MVSPELPLHRLEVLSFQERRQVLAGFNATGRAVPETTLVERFESQVSQRPEATAVMLEEATLSYGELNGRANQLAHYLIALGVGPETLVGVYLERSLELVVSLLGILKAGGAYVPLDPSYPQVRLAYMLEDASPSVVISTEELAEDLPGGRQVLALGGAELRAALADYSKENLRDEGQLGGLLPQHPAYVIYTSGSTGQPKGVVIDHYALSVFLSAMSPPLVFDPDDRHLAVTTVGFDISILELFLPLCHGAQVVLTTDAEARDPMALSRLIQRRDITSMQATPSHWQLLVEQMSSGLHMRQMLSGGEALKVELGQALRDYGGEIYNLYGPTETTIWSSMELVSELALMEGQGSIVAIGQPLDKDKCYVLDAGLEPLPVGV